MPFKSIYSKLILIISIIVLLSVGFFEFVVYISNHNTYYQTVEQYISNKAIATAEFYKVKEISKDEKADAFDLIFAFSDSRIRMQITDEAGVTIADTGAEIGKKVEYEDIKKALEGKESKLIFNDITTKGKTFSYSALLIRNKQLTGSVRISVLLDGVDAEIRRLTIQYGIIGLVIVVIAIVAGALLSRTIVNPIRKVSNAATALGAGDLTTRANVKSNDETGKLADSFNKMAGELEQADKIKTEFISQISHELRTPLTNIMGWANTVQQSEPTEYSIIEKGLGIIIKETERLTGMVEELLDFSRFQTNDFKLSVKRSNLADICKSVVELIAPRTERHGLNIDATEISNTYSNVDENRIKQILINILDNSIKHMQPNGTIKITCYKDGNKAIIIISDNGSGIPPEKLPRIKELFYKADEQISGVGLGLAICDRLAILHNGNLEIQSEIGKGTTVILTLPIAD